MQSQKQHRNSSCTKVVIAIIYVLLSQTAFANGPYTYSVDGSEVTDTATSLVWRRCSEGQIWSGGTCTGAAITRTHQAALEHAASQVGWRLPNVKELSSLANKANINPAVDAVAFPGTVPSYYWSSTPYLNSNTASNAWEVNFSEGHVGYSNRADLYRVRLVR